MERQIVTAASCDSQTELIFWHWAILYCYVTQCDKNISLWTSAIIIPQYYQENNRFCQG